MQQRLGVAVRLLEALEDQVAGRLERGRGRRSGRPSAGRADRPRSARRPRRPCAASVSSTCAFGDHAVLQPVGDVLARDAQRRAVFHQRRRRGCRAPSSSRRPGRSSARRSRGCPGALLSSSCCDLRVAPVRLRRRAGSSAARRAGRRAPRRRRSSRAPSAPRRRRPGGSAARAAWPRSATAPRRCWRRPWGGAIFCSSMSAIRSGMAHMPLPICAWPRRPQARPTATLCVLVGRDPRAGLHVALADHRAGLHRGVDLVAGAVEEAGVDEDDAVAAASAMQALRLTVVRRSSSMMPTLTVLARQAEQSSTRPNSSSVNATSSGPCIFGLTM